MTVQTRINEDAQTKPQRTKRHLLPAVSLFFLAPLVGEFLLGNLPITWLWVLLTLAPLYGGGAILIRETARHFGWGWPSIVVLGLLYAIVEEAFITQSLFNPNYVGLRLLDYGYISSLGISAWWTVFVLGIHTVWSTSVPIALVESLTPETGRRPWLGLWGIVITALIFAAGCFMTFTFQLAGDPFMATTAQFMVSAVVVLILAAIAIVLGRSQNNSAPTTQEAPTVQRVAITTFVLGSAFMSLAIVHDLIPAILNVTAQLGLLAGGSLLIWRWSRRAAWSAFHEFAAAGGLLLVYAWYGFVQVPSVGGDISPAIDAIGNLIFASGAVILLFIGWRRLSHHTRQVA